MNPKTKLIQDEANPIPAEIIAESLVKIGDAMRQLSGTRLTRDAVIALIHDKSKVSKATIKIVMNNLDDLELDWLKTAPRKH
jgi:hypothetical protein